MPTFLVERYAPGPGADRTPGTASAGPGKAAGIRLLLSATVPSDEIALSLFEAPTRRALVRALEAGGVAYIRIVEALIAGPGVGPDTPPGPGSSGGERSCVPESIQGGIA